jgi:hypothetical protein
MNSLELIVAMVRFETSELGVSEQEKLLRDKSMWWIRANCPSAYWNLVWLAAEQKWSHLYNVNPILSNK